MARRRALMGIFSYLDDLLASIEEMKKARVKIHTVYSPMARHEIQEALGLKPSPVRFFTLLGAVLGFVLGVSLAVYAGLQWEFITSGKPVMAWIPFMIVGFEFTILFGIFGNLAGVLINGRMPRFRLPDHYDPRFTQDRFGVLAFCTEEEREAVSRLMKEAGAEEIHEVES